MLTGLVPLTLDHRDQERLTDLEGTVRRHERTIRRADRLLAFVDQYRNAENARVRRR